MLRQFVGLLALVAACSAKVTVDVYYESLCPDSQAFITQQLYPAVKSEFKDFVDVNFIPFGKSTFETRGSDVLFTCHHGPNECYGNKVHACAIEHIEANSYRADQSKASLILDYINCLMKAGKNFPDNIYPGERCARELQIEGSWRIISECANSTRGSLLLKEYGEKTNRLKPELTSVPTIALNQQYNPDIQNRILNNFRNSLCDLLPMPPRPQYCAMNSGPRSTAVIPAVAFVTYILARMF